MKNQTKATVFALLAVLCWSTVATAFKIGLSELNYIQLLLLASLSSTLTLFIILIAQSKLHLLKISNKKEIINSMFMGALNPFAYYLILFKAYELLPAQEALTLNYTWAIVVVLFSIPLLNQSIKLIELFALLVSFVGVIVIATHGNLFSMEFSNSFGVFLALISSIVWALYWIFNIRDKRENLIKLFWNFVFGSIYISVLFFIQNNWIISISSLLPAIYIGLFEMSIAFFFWLSALKSSETTAKVSNIIYLSPFLSLIFINIFLGEKILITTFIGLILIISGIIFQQLIKNKS